MRHGMKSGMNHFIVHGKHKHLMKPFQHHLFEITLIFAIDMSDSTMG